MAFSHELGGEGTRSNRTPQLGGEGTGSNRMPWLGSEGTRSNRIHGLEGKELGLTGATAWRLRDWV